MMPVTAMMARVSSSDDPSQATDAASQNEARGSGLERVKTHRRGDPARASALPLAANGLVQRRERSKSATFTRPTGLLPTGEVPLNLTKSLSCQRLRPRWHLRGLTHRSKVCGMQRCHVMALRATSQKEKSDPTRGGPLSQEMVSSLRSHHKPK